MKILLIASGGDAPGMNKFIAQMYKRYGSSLYACKGGFEGLYNADIVPARFFEPLKVANSAGCCIKSGRFPQFKQKKYFNKALENAKNFDFVVVMGGNGSKKGVKELAEGGVKAIFVPATIDNDVEGTNYSIGFHTAVAMVCYAVRNVMPSMQSHSRACVFEVMGRHSGEIAQNAAKILQPQFLITQPSQLNIPEMASEILKRHKKDQATSIIIRENIIDCDVLTKKLNDEIGQRLVKNFVVGHLQRGGKPTKAELKMSAAFAHATIKAIGKNQSGVAIEFVDGKMRVQEI